MLNKWAISKTDKSSVKNLSKILNVSEIISSLLVARGINTFQEAKHFFRPQASHLHDPFLMLGMSDAVNRVSSAISNNEKILIFGDYDVDGVTSVSMMYLFLLNFNNNIDYYIPCRHNEGYGISYKGVDYAEENNFSLIISLDCGISSIEEIKYAKKKNIDFIICDHHTPGDKIPDAISVLNPKQNNCKYPYKELSGCGVGFKLIQAFSIKNKIDFSQIICFLDLVAISIGADIVPMTGENRVLAFLGLELINSNPRKAVKELLSDRIDKSKSKIKMRDLIFGIAPKINATGRLKHAQQAVKFLILKDNDKIKQMALEMEETNTRRRELDKEITKEALSMIDAKKCSTVLYNKKWHKGVIGIVASRLIEQYYRPTIIFTDSNNGLLVGSARSIQDFDIYNAILKCANLCEKFGGHKFAAGLSIKKENFNRFSLKFENIVKQSFGTSPVYPTINIDKIIDINNIDNKLFRILEQFAPFGPKNRRPIFASYNLLANASARKIGNEKAHLKFNIKRNKNQDISAIGFNMGNFLDFVNNNQFFDACYTIDLNKWKGNFSLQMKLQDLKHKSNS